MSDTIELTPEQWEKAKAYRQQCRDITFNTDPLDDEKAKAALCRMYKLLGFKYEPDFQKFASPMAAKEWITDNYGEDKVEKVFYGNQDSHWIVLYNFAKEQLNEEMDADQLELLDIWNDIAKNCAVWYHITPETDELDKKPLVAICDRPAEMHLDDQDRWHNPDGYALLFRDGRGVCLYEDLRIPEEKEWIIFEKEKITLEKIDDEVNGDIQRVMIEQMGIDEYLAARDMRLIDADVLPIKKGSDRSILRILSEDNQGRKWFTSTDGSTGKVHHMEVDPDAQSVAEGHNSISPILETKIIASS